MNGNATIWAEALKKLQSALPDYHFKTFFMNAAPFYVHDGAFYFEVGSPNEKALLSKKYADKVRAAIIEAFITLEGAAPEVQVIYMSPQEAEEFREQHRAGYGGSDAMQYSSAPDSFPVTKNTAEMPANQAVLPTQTGAVLTEPAPAPLSPAGSEMLTLNPSYTFESFVVGESNEMANAAAHAVADNPGHVHNPLFLYGGVGLGKTHLMHAIGNQIRRTYPEKKIVYVTAETFTNELISMIRSSRNEHLRQEFRDKYRKADVLMIDDIQFIAGKDTTQDEFFHTFNALYGDYKQIVISSDRPPKELNQLEERIESRFEGGAIVDIQTPDFETRVAILQRKHSERMDMLPMDDEVFYYIAEQPNNTRTLQGHLSRVNMYATLRKLPRVDVTTAKKALAEISRAEKRQITAEEVINVVSDYYGIDTDDILGSRRTKDVAHARKVAMYVTRELTNLSTPKIAEHFHKKDHTTVLHAEKDVRTKMNENANVKKEVEDITARLRNA